MHRIKSCKVLYIVFLGPCSLKQDIFKGRNEVTVNISHNQIFTFWYGCVRLCLMWYFGHRWWVMEKAVWCLHSAILSSDLLLLLDLCSPPFSLSFSLTCPKALLVPLLTHCSSVCIHTHIHRVEKEVEEEEKGRRRLTLKCVGDISPF